MFVTYPDFVPPVARLFSLANTPFDPSVFKAACEAFAPFDPKASDDNLWSFPFDPCGEPRLLVAVETEPTGEMKPCGGLIERPVMVDCAILSCCWWETSLRTLHSSDETFEAERAEFDFMYAKTLATTTALLGLPLLLNSDPNSGYRHAVWRGRTGLLVLQQSDYDCQYGDDINFWIQRWSGPDPRPSIPFIDWLMKLGSQQLQA